MFAFLRFRTLLLDTGKNTAIMYLAFLGIEDRRRSPTELADLGLTRKTNGSMSGTPEPHGITNTIPLTSTMRRSTKQATNRGPFALLVERKPGHVFGRTATRASQKLVFCLPSCATLLGQCLPVACGSQSWMAYFNRAWSTIDNVFSNSSFQKNSKCKRNGVYCWFWVPFESI